MSSKYQSKIQYPSQIREDYYEVFYVLKQHGDFGPHGGYFKSYWTYLKAMETLKNYFNAKKILVDKNYEIPSELSDIVHPIESCYDFNDFDDFERLLKANEAATDRRIEEVIDNPVEKICCSKSQKRGADIQYSLDGNIITYMALRYRMVYEIMKLQCNEYSFSDMVKHASTSIGTPKEIVDWLTEFNKANKSNILEWRTKFYNAITIFYQRLHDSYKNSPSNTDFDVATLRNDLTFICSPYYDSNYHFVNSQNII